MVVLGILLFGLISFWLGSWWNQFQYDDWCLDMGGGKNPGEYKYCIVGDISENENFNQ